MSISNELIYGEVHGMKKDDKGNALAGATIGLFYTEGKEPIMTVISGEDGTFSFNNIPYGEYVVREIEAPEASIIYIDPCIHRDTVLSQIIEAFDIGNYIVEYDDHYHCKKCVGDLFN